MLIIAHRTCPREAPENSLEGIRIAFEQNSDAVEIDLRLSIDGKPYLMHDNTMHRTVGPVLPVELTPSRFIDRLRVRANGLPVPTLAQALDALPAGKQMAVDVKTPWSIAALVREVKRRRMEDSILVWCQSFRAASYASRNLPRAETGYLKTAFGEEAGLKFLSNAVLAGAPAISAHWLAITPEFVGRAHARGLKVYSWHGDFPLTPEKLRTGLDGLVTDYPLLARKAIDAALQPDAG